MGQYGGTDIAGPVHEALTVLEEAQKRDGVLTNAACALAEEKLLSLGEKAKAYTLLLIGHAHLDMNWMWSWDETVATVVNTFKTMLKLMEEYPDFCFSQFQASTYQIIEQFAPELMPQIQQRIREGRWEVTASAWVETDKNMPATESLLNHIRCTKEYLRDHWGVDPASLDLDFSPDTFGHSAFLPELDALAKAVDTSGIGPEPDLWNRGEGAGVGFGLQAGNIPTHESGSGLTRIFQVFNSTAADRQETLWLTVWDWPGDTDRMYITDGQGNPLPFDPPSEEKTYWAHRYFTVPVTVSVPAWGYSTLILRESQPAECTAGHLYIYQPDRQRFPFADILLENPYLKARFDGRTGALVSLFDKEAGAERIRAGESGGLRYIRSQRNDMSAWVIDRYLSVEPVTELLSLKALDGKLEPGLETEHRVKHSRVTTRVTLAKGTASLTLSPFQTLFLEIY